VDLKTILSDAFNYLYTSCTGWHLRPNRRDYNNSFDGITGKWWHSTKKIASQEDIVEANASETHLE
jgi:hypothetical protein